MSDIDTERSGSILPIQLNRPAKKNAMTSSMYVSVENEEFSSRLRSADPKEALAAFLETRRPDFTKSSNSKMPAKAS